jgi:iron complex outermembrane receptor protein
LTIGFVVTPSDTDFSIAVDYFDIQIENTIQQPGVGGILFQCYGSVGLSDPLCDRVGPRDPDLQNQISFVDTSYLNIGKQQSRGYDLNLLYEHQFSLGKLTLDGIVTYLDKQNYELFGDFVRLEGRWGFPRLSANTQVRYDWRDWQFGWFMEFIGESEEAPVYDPGTTNQDRQNRTPNMLYHTLSTRYTRSNWEAIATVRNVFNKEPPYVANGQGNQGASRFYNTLPGVGYDLYGRSYILQLGYKF